MVSPEAEPMNWNLSEETDSLVLDDTDSQPDLKSVMEMPCLDPKKVLEALSPHLGKSGDIKAVEEVEKLVPLMKDTNKLVNRCIYVNVLKATGNEEMFGKFIDDGGWDILNVWLQDAKSEENTPFLIELLQLYQMMPVKKFSVDLLKSNNCAKTIKGLCKLAETEEIKSVSNEIVERWMDRIREIREGDATENVENSTGDKSDAKKKKKDKNKKTEKPKDVQVKNEPADGEEGSKMEEGESTEKPRDVKIKDLKDKIKEEKEKLDKGKHKHDHHRHHHHKSSKDKEHRHHSSNGEKSDKHRHDKHRHHDEKKKEGSGSSSRHRDRISSKDSDSSSQDNKKEGSDGKKVAVNSAKKDDSKKVDGVSKKSENKRTSDHLTNSTKSKVMKTSSSKDVKGKDSEKKEVKDRPKTVKPFTTKFRDTGLTEPPLPARRKVEEAEREKLKLVIKKTPIKLPRIPKIGRATSGSAMVTSSSSTTSTSSDTSTTTTKPIERKPRPVLPAPVVRTNSYENQKSPTEPPGSGKVKLIPPQRRPKAYELSDSSDFMNALIAPAPVAPIKKKRKTSIGNAKPPSTPPSPPTPTRNVPSFYKETLDTAEDKEKLGDSQDFPMTEAEQAKAASEANMGSGDATIRDRSDGDSNSSHSSSNNGKKKKKVSWKDDKNLRAVFFFELDETERVNVNKHNFEDMKKQEMATERHGIERAKIISADKMTEKMGWQRPSLISNLPPRSTEYGARSTERDVQRNREQGVLQAIFFSKDMIPDTPTEPEAETNDVEEPRIIPLEDESTGEDAYVPTDDSAQTQPQQQQQLDTASYDNQQMANQQQTTARPGQPQASLPPEIANLLGQLSSQVQAQNQTTPVSATEGATQPNEASSLPPQITGMLESLQQTAQQQPVGAVDPATGAAAPDTTSLLSSVQNLLTNFMGQTANPETPSQDQAQHDVLTEKLKQILEPFQKQLQGTMVPPAAGMMMPPGPAPPFPIPMPPPVGPDGQILPPPPGIRLPPGFMASMVGRPPMRPPFPGAPPGPGPVPGPGRGMGPNDDFGGPRFGGPPGMRGGRGNFQPRGGVSGGRGGPGGPVGQNRGRSRGRGREQQICRHFQMARGCKYGDSCQFLHVKMS